MPEPWEDPDEPRAVRGVWLGLLLSGAAWLALAGLWRWWS